MTHVGHGVAGTAGHGVVHSGGASGRSPHGDWRVFAMLAGGAVASIGWRLAAEVVLRAFLEPVKVSSAQHDRHGSRDGTDQARAHHLDEHRRWLAQTGREMTLSAGSGPKLRAIVLDPDRAEVSSHRYVICWHSRTGSVQGTASTAHRFARMGCTVVLPVGRGNRPDEGRYLGMGLLESRDLLRWIREVVVHDPQARIVLCGVSMGAVAVMLACGSRELSDHVVGAIAECGYADAFDQVTFTLRRYAHLPRHLAKAMTHTVNALCRSRAGFDLRDADCLGAMRHTHVPMLFIEAGNDQVIDPADCDRLFDACASAVRERTVIAYARHAACASADPERYWDAVSGFMQRLSW